MFEETTSEKQKMEGKYFKIKRKDMALVQFIIEGYEGLATVTTMDSQVAIIRVSIMPDFLGDFFKLLEDLKRDFNLEEIDYREN